MIVRIQPISDTHGHLPETPDCDIMIHAGDWTPDSDHSHVTQHNFFMNRFNPWLDQQPADEKIVICGNHDYIGQDDPDLLHDHMRAHYLMDSSIEVKGLKIFGMPWSCLYNDWAFMKEDEDLKHHWDLIPSDTDVLVVHGPPYGMCDRIDPWGNIGSRTLRDRIEDLNLKAVITGHVHPGRGVQGDVWNVSYLDGNNEVAGLVPIIEIEV